MIRRPPWNVVTLAAALSALTFAAATTAADDAPPSRAVVIDGRFDEWGAVPLALDDGADAPGAEVDFGQVRVASDGRYVDLLVDLGRDVNVQALDGRVKLVLDADGDPRTGGLVHGLAGADVVVTFTPPDAKDPARRGMGAGVALVEGGGRGPAQEGPIVTPYALGLTFGPTYASRTIEVRLERGRGIAGAPALLRGESFSARLIALDAGGHVVDETNSFGGRLVPYGTATAPAGGPNVDPIRRDPRADLRVMSWNARYGALVERGSLARRVIDAIDPDVILVQELTDANTAAEIESLLNRAAPGAARDRRGPWKAFVGAGGGNLRTAVLSRLPQRRLEAIEPIPYPNWEGRYLRTCGAVVDADGKHLLVLSVHLKCCGRLGDSNDRKRETETGAIRDAVRAVLASGGVDAGIDGVVIGGDMNLVGGRRPLDTLADGLDVDGSSLAIAEPLQLDGRSNATWSDAEEPFVPGRLDYVLFADGAMELVNSFVFDSVLLDPKWLDAHALRVEDVEMVSDHRPVVLDLRWRGDGGE